MRERFGTPVSAVMARACLVWALPSAESSNEGIAHAREGAAARRGARSPLQPGCSPCWASGVPSWREGGRSPGHPLSNGLGSAGPGPRGCWRRHGRAGRRVCALGPRRRGLAAARAGADGLRGQSMARSRTPLVVISARRISRRPDSRRPRPLPPPSTLARDRGERGHEAWALRLLGEIASRAIRRTSSRPAHYRQALALADELGMRPLVAHCHLGLGKLYRRTGKREQAQEHLTTATAMYREMDMRFWLEQAEAIRVHFPEELPWRHDPERQPGAPIHPAPEVRHVARHEVGGVGGDRRREEWPILRRQLRRRQPLGVARRRLPDDSNRGEAPSAARAAPRAASPRDSVRPRRLARGEVRSVTRPAAPSSTRSAESPSGLYAAVKRTLASRKTRWSATTRDGAARPASSPSACGAPPAHAGWRDPPRPGARSPRRRRWRLGSPQRDPGRSFPPSSRSSKDRAGGEPQASAHGFGQGDLAPRRDNQRASGVPGAREAIAHLRTSS